MDIRKWWKLRQRPPVVDAVKEEKQATKDWRKFRKDGLLEDEGQAAVDGVSLEPDEGVRWVKRLK